MGTYETVLIVVFFLLTIVFGCNGVRALSRAGAEEDEKLRKAKRRKAFCWLAFGLMLLCSAFYLLFRVSWLFLVVVLIGTATAAYVIGAGIVANMREH